MGVPKNYNKTVNTKRRVEALNELDFYFFKFDIEYTEEYQKTIQEAELNGNVILLDFDVMFQGKDKFSKTCSKKFSALNEDDANRKMNEWLEAKKEEGVISTYDVNFVKSNSFYDELKEKNLLPLIDNEEFNKVREESKKGVV